MTAARRIATLLGLTLALVVGASLPASAGYSETVSTPVSVATLTVKAPTNLVVSDYCTLTTTRTDRTVDPVTGWTSTSTTSSTTGTTTVYHDDVTTVSGNTTTTISRRTTLHVSASWTGSTSPGVTGYSVMASMAGGAPSPLYEVTGTSMSGSADARYTAYGITVSVRTKTSYGWTADSAQSRLLTCA